MAFRIAKFVVRGEIDNRTKDRVYGFLELAEGGGRMTLDLVGNGHPDLAGSLIRFHNRSPEPLKPADFISQLSTEQTGRVGDMTASHRVKDLIVPLDAYETMDEAARSSAFRWSNCLYLEWFSEINGRVVMEGVGFDIEVVEGPLWTLTTGEIREQADSASESMMKFLSQVTAAVEIERVLGEEEEAIPAAEAEMDDEMDRMDLLTERIARRLEKEGCSNADWERIYEEESARLRQQRGEPEPLPLTPSEEEERRHWIEEMNAAAEDALRDAEAEKWKGDCFRENHPLVEECHDLALKIFNEKITPQGTHPEHPLSEIRDGLLLATGKLAGALNRASRDEEWPPDELAAPSVLIFLKKARARLRDALLGMDAADEQNLATSAWRHETRQSITRILLETQRLIQEARSVLLSDEDGEG